MSLEGKQLGRYRILHLLGRGGMGEVYLAEDPRIGQQVAIKVIVGELSLDSTTPEAQEALHRFQQEAKAIVKLDHPQILSLFDYGEEQFGGTTIVYLVMPHRPEGSLTQWMRQYHPGSLLAPPDVAHIVRQAAEALQHAHDRQIIHQDVKPSNFLLRHHPEAPTRPDIFLADFGIARLMAASSTMSQAARGTPTYMAPEQWRGHPVPASDQYALAIMTYQLLTGRPPFQGGKMQVMFQHLNTPPEPPSTFKLHLSPEIDAVLSSALAKDPKERFASVTAFARAFQQATEGVMLADASPLIKAPSAAPPGADPRVTLPLPLTAITQPVETATTVQPATLITETSPTAQPTTITATTPAATAPTSGGPTQPTLVAPITSPGITPGYAVSTDPRTQAITAPPPGGTGGSTGTLPVPQPQRPAPRNLRGSRLVALLAAALLVLVVLAAGVAKFIPGLAASRGGTATATLGIASAATTTPGGSPTNTPGATSTMPPGQTPQPTQPVGGGGGGWWRRQSNIHTNAHADAHADIHTNAHVDAHADAHPDGNGRWPPRPHDQPGNVHGVG